MNTSDTLAVSLEDKVDALGMLNAQIEALSKKAEAIKDELKDIASAPGANVKEFTGGKYRAVYSASNRTVVNYKALIEDLGVPEEYVAKFTSTTAVYALRVKAI